MSTRGGEEPIDGLNNLMDYARTFPPMSREEEIALVQTVKQRGSGYEKALERLCMTHLPFVVNNAYKIHRKSAGVMDLVSEGLRGLLAAIDLFEPSFNARLITYADPRIRVYMRRFMLKAEGVCRVPVNAWRMHKKILGYMAGEEVGFVPTARQIEFHKLPPSPATVVLSDLQTTDRDVTTAPAMVTVDPSGDPSDILMESDDHEAWQELLGYLSDRNRFIITKAYGLDGDKRTLRKLASELHLSVQRVSVCRNNSLKALRRRMAEQGVSSWN